MDEPDFEKLRAERDANIAKAVRETATKLWGKEAGEKAYASHINYGGGSAVCYCACATGGPCEHIFGGWREFEDGRGGEQFCTKCGMGAMSHSMAVSWD
jgi:hypothetical protein